MSNNLPFLIGGFDEQFHLLYFNCEVERTAFSMLLDVVRKVNCFGIATGLCLGSTVYYSFQSYTAD